MSVEIQDFFTLKGLVTNTLQLGEPILASDMLDLARNTHHDYAHAALRTLFNQIELNPKTQFNVGYVDFVELPFQYSDQRQEAGLVMQGRVDNLDIRVQQWNAAKTVLHNSTASVGAGVREFTLPIASPGPTNDDIVVVISHRINSGFSGKLGSFWLYEDLLAVGELP